MSKGTISSAAINLAKVCVGSGVLALPYAFFRGGLIFGPIVMTGIALLNFIGVMMMMECKKETENHIVPPSISSTYSKICYVAYGWIGVYLADMSLIITLLGVCVTYLITSVAMISDIYVNYINNDIIITNNDTTILTFIMGGIIFLPCCAKDVGILSSVSLLALVSLIIGIFALFLFGIYEFGDDVNNTQENYSYVPKNISDVFSFMGIVSFCFGLTSLCFPVESSMEDKKSFSIAVIWCLIFVVSLYTIVGDGLYILYANDDNGVNSNILSNLPQNSVTADIVRLCISLVCLLSIPLTFLPPSQMIEQYWRAERAERMSLVEKGEYEVIGGGNEKEDNTVNVSIRLIIMICCTLSAAIVPCFGTIVSLLGAFTVSILSYLLPPLLHLKLIGNNDRLDYSYTIVGIAITIIGTTIEVMEVYEKAQAGVC